jgi:hypothetical protein
MRWVGHEACMKAVEKSITTFWFKNLRGRNRLGCPGMDGMIILKRVSKK